MQGETTFNDHASLDRDGDFRTCGLDRLPGSQEFPRVPKSSQEFPRVPKSSQEFPRVPKSSQEFRYKFALNVQGALGARDAHVSIHFSLGAITSAKKRLKCNSMASVVPSLSHILPAERLSAVPRAPHPSSWRQESWLLPSPANTQVVRSHAQGVHQIPGRSRKCRTVLHFGKPGENLSLTAVHCQAHGKTSRFRFILSKAKSYMIDTASQVPFGAPDHGFRQR